MNDSTPIAQTGHGPDLGPFDWADPLRLEDQLSEDERMLRDAANVFAQTTLQPKVTDAYREETVDPTIFKAMGDAGLLGATIPEEYGGLGASYVTYGLIAREIERVDSGYRSMMSVQSSLVMYPINAYGTDAQRQKYLPGLAAGTLIGCFGLTEPDAGSDPAGMKTTARSWSIMEIMDIRWRQASGPPAWGSWTSTVAVTRRLGRSPARWPAVCV